MVGARGDGWVSKLDGAQGNEEAGPSTDRARWWSLAAGAEAGWRAVGGGRRERRWTVVVGENPERREGRIEEIGSD